MPKVARLNDPISHGGNIITASGDVLTNGLGTARVGDQVSCAIHGINRIVGGASTTHTNSPMTARVGDACECGATISAGSPDRDVGDSSTTVTFPPATQVTTKPRDIPVKTNPAVDSANATSHAAYLNNPAKYKNPEASANGVKENYPGTPDTTGTVDPEPPKKCASGHDATVIAFLQKVLAEAAKGTWRESGQRGNPSNPNITNIWRSLGYPNSGIWMSDQTPWCAGFVNLALKESGLAYLKEAGARNQISRGPSIGMISVPIAQMQPGDICLWTFNHVNFCYTANNGKFSFVGGNQTPSGAGKNNPDDGDVTNSWKTGWTPSHGGIVAVMRPKCP